MTWSIIRATVLVIRVSFAWLLTNSVEEAGGTVQYSMLDDILVQQQEEMGGTYSPFSFQVIDSQRWLLFCLMLVVLVKAELIVQYHPKVSEAVSYFS